MPDTVTNAANSDDTLKRLHTTVYCYLSTLQSMADAMGEACPPVGVPYRQRISRLRARLAFDSTVPAIEESCAVVSNELKEYASKASGYMDRYCVELRQAIAGLEGIAREFARNQSATCEHLRRIARDLQNTPAAAALLDCAENMGRESEAILQRMREEAARVDTRLAGGEITDPVTGLINRREIERRVEAAQELGQLPVLLLFEFRDAVPDEVAQQAGARLSAQFRHNDLISRWSDRQFLVFFEGQPDTADQRARQAAPWLAGRYLLDSGETWEGVVETRLVHAPLTDLDAVPVS